MSAIGTFRIWRDVRLESVMRTKADVRQCYWFYESRPIVSSFRACQCLLDFSAAVRALVDEVDFRHVPVGLDVSYVHGKS